MVKLGNATKAPPVGWWMRVVQEVTEWVDSEGATATLEELEEKLQEAQNAINPITSKLYGSAGGAGGDYAPGEDDDDQEPFRSHDEL